MAHPLGLRLWWIPIRLFKNLRCAMRLAAICGPLRFCRPWTQSSGAIQMCCLTPLAIRFGPRCDVLGRVGPDQANLDVFRPCWIDGDHLGCDLSRVGCDGSHLGRDLNHVGRDLAHLPRWDLIVFGVQVGDSRSQSCRRWGVLFLIFALHQIQALRTASRPQLSRRQKP